MLQAVLDLQQSYDSRGNDAMEIRGRLIRYELPEALRQLVRDTGEPDLAVEGSDGAGYKNRVPWVRLFSKEKSPSATGGWYVVLLFAADGSAVHLSLNQGTTGGAAGTGDQRRAF